MPVEAAPPQQAPDGEYRVFALKYRPQIFADVVGQSTVVRQLQGEIQDNRVGHAYLFTGPRGVGKTSMARIFAKALNCVNGPTPSPCGRCTHCIGIANDSDLDVVEVDAATYTRKEETIELLEGIDRVAFNARYKVYIIDEVHMFSTHSFNVLLKRLEEPPPGVVFILATTNPEKIPDTVISRCRRLEFDRMDASEIVGRLSEIADREKIEFAAGERDRILEAIALASEGGMRDAQVSFDQLISLSMGVISLENARQLLGVVESDLLHQLLEGILKRDHVSCLMLVHELVEKGRDLQRFIKTFTSYLRDAMLLKAEAPADLLKVSRSNPEKLRGLVRPVSMSMLLNTVQQFLELEGRMKGSVPARFLLEFTLMKLTAIHPGFVLDAMDSRNLNAAPTPPRNTPSGSQGGGATSSSSSTSSTTKTSAEPRSNEPQASAQWEQKKPAPAQRNVGRSGSLVLAASAEEHYDDEIADVVVGESSPAQAPSEARVIPVLPDDEAVKLFRSILTEKIPSLASIFRDATIVPAAGNVLEIALSAHDAIMKPGLERPEKQIAIQDAMKRAFGSTMKVRISVASNQGLPNDPHLLSEVVGSRDDREYELAATPALQDATDAPASPRADRVGALSFTQALAQYPEFRRAIELVKESLHAEPTMFNGQRLSNS